MSREMPGGMSGGRQRQRHGVAKNLAEGIGGLLVGAAAVVLLRGLLRARTGASPSQGHDQPGAISHQNPATDDAAA